VFQDFATSLMPWVRVACTLGARIRLGSRGTVFSGGDGHVLVLGNLNEGWHMQDLVLHMS
jgi:hypothetical protein